VERKKEWKEGIEKAGAPPFSRLSREGGDFDLVNPGEDLKVQDCKREARLSDEPDYVGTDAIGCPAERSSAVLGEREPGRIDANSQKRAIELRTLLLQRMRRARAHPPQRSNLSACSQDRSAQSASPADNRPALAQLLVSDSQSSTLAHCARLEWLSFDSLQTIPDNARQRFPASWPSYRIRMLIPAPMIPS
jgi:hypothetical protein